MQGLETRWVWSKNDVYGLFLSIFSRTVHLHVLPSTKGLLATGRKKLKCSMFSNFLNMYLKKSVIRLPQCVSLSFATFLFKSTSSYVNNILLVMRYTFFPNSIECLGKFLCMPGSYFSSKIFFVSSKCCKNKLL